LELVQSVLGAVTSQSVITLVDALVDRDIAAGLDLINRMIDDGVDPRQLAREVVEYLRAVMLVKLGDGSEILSLPDETLSAIKTQAARADAQMIVRAISLFNDAMVDIKSSLLAIPQLPLELAFVESTSEMTSVESTSIVAEPIAAGPATTTVPQPAKTSSPPPPEPPPADAATASKPTTESSTADITVDTVRGCLPKVVQNLEAKSKVMAESLRSQTRLMKVSGNEIYFSTTDMLKERFDKPQPQEAINEAFSQVIGSKVVVRFLADSELSQGQSGKGQVDEDAEALLKVAEELGGKVVK
jgi:DNA polymerase-3 subunit gamma/tau